MTRSILLKSALCALMVPTLSCNLLKVSDDEESRSGRGAKVFDPYQSTGAIRLSLQTLNGCAVLGTGEMVKKNTLDIPYPSLCLAGGGPDPNAKAPPTGTMRILGKTTYFLNQLTITDTTVQAFVPTDPIQALKWITTQSQFRKLNWNNVGQLPDEWKYIKGLAGNAEDAWTREVPFEGADWEDVKDDKFTIEVIDQDGVSRTSVEYNRSELLAGTSHAGHSRFAWRAENLQAPRYPGDLEPRGVAFRQGRLPQPPIFRTLARLDLVGSTNPFKTFTTPDLKGPGALKVTWSQMKDDPVYFPVTFVPPEEVPATCSDDEGQPKQCGFGLDPQLTFAPPTDGSFYKKGETVHVYVDLRDSLGNRLHSKDLMPSPSEITRDQANGIIIANPPYNNATLEADSAPVVTLAGPLHKLRVQGDPFKAPEYMAPPGIQPFIDDQGTSGIGLALSQAKIPTRYSVKLPADAEAGTYVALVKFTRYFMGERVTKLNPFFFQVGQDEQTTYPGNVGNCQICHRGVLSLDNLRHGLSVDNVEACKSCHVTETDVLGRPQEFIHRIHMTSTKYPAERNDCTLCHLTRSSAVRPSLAVCSSCHPSVHDNKYFTSTFQNDVVPNRFGNCAQSCHGDQVPNSHILPN